MGQSFKKFFKNVIRAEQAEGLKSLEQEELHKFEEGKKSVCLDKRKQEEEKGTRWRKKGRWLVEYSELRMSQ